MALAVLLSIIFVLAVMNMGYLVRVLIWCSFLSGRFFCPALIISSVIHLLLLGLQVLTVANDAEPIKESFGRVSDYKTWKQLPTRFRYSL